MSKPSEECFDQNGSSGDRQDYPERPPRESGDNDRKNQANKSVLDAFQTEGLIFLAEKAGFKVVYEYSSKNLSGYGYRKEIISVSCGETILISRDAILRELRDIRKEKRRIFIGWIRWLASKSEDVKLPEVLKGKEDLFALKKSFHSDNKLLVDEVNNAFKNETAMPNSLYLNEIIRQFFQIISKEFDFVFTLTVLFEREEARLNGRLNLMAETKIDNFLIDLFKWNEYTVNVKKVRKGCRDNAFYKNTITDIKSVSGDVVFNAKEIKSYLIAQLQGEEEVIIPPSVP